ncbi:hypothetical protein JHK82_011900 [Glycine max]|nr:hypothetical protein JHK86_011899 [Glycine max]KAG5153931.1 hypothetical protein JHK82_011900 [Glycine max]
MPSIDSGDGRTVLLSVVGLRSEPGVKLPAEAGAKVDYRAQSGGVATMGVPKHFKSYFWFENQSMRDVAVVRGNTMDEPYLGVDLGNVDVLVHFVGMKDEPCEIHNVDPDKFGVYYAINDINSFVEDFESIDGDVLSDFDESVDANGAGVVHSNSNMEEIYKENKLHRKQFDLDNDDK